MILPCGKIRGIYTTSVVEFRGKPIRQEAGEVAIYFTPLRCGWCSLLAGSGRKG